MQGLKRYEKILKVTNIFNMIYFLFLLTPKLSAETKTQGYLKCAKVKFSHDFPHLAALALT